MVSLKGSVEQAFICSHSVGTARVHSGDIFCGNGLVPTMCMLPDMAKVIRRLLVGSENSQNQTCNALYCVCDDVTNTVKDITGLAPLCNLTSQRVTTKTVVQPPYSP
jgi:hypothetical protein